MSQLAECGICHKEKECTHFTSNLLMCAECLITQQAFEKQIVDGAEERVMASRIAAEARQIDSNIKVSSDIFNAKTITIHKIKTAIDADPEVVNKNFALAQLIEERFIHLKDIIFSRRQEIVEAENEQKAIQVYYNDLAKRLRQEERDRIKLNDTQYKPLEPVIRKPKAINIKKFNKDEITRVAADTGISVVILQMLCVAKGLSPVDAARLYKETKSMVQ
jgi:hypothetical protein